MMRPSSPPLLAFALAAGLAAPAAAILPEPDEAAEAPPPAAALCTAGTVFHGASQTCVAPETGLVDDDALYAELRRLAYAGRYEPAARLLAAMRERDTPRVLTAEGFILRRTGRVEEGLAAYARALAIDPEFHLARAYLGLYHLETGDRAAARRQLDEIEALGGAGSEGWRMLEEALGGGFY